MTALSQKQFGRLERAFPDGCDVFGFGPFLFVIRRPKSRRVEEPAPMRTVSLQPLKVPGRRLINTRAEAAEAAAKLDDAKRVVAYLNGHGGEARTTEMILAVFDITDGRSIKAWDAIDLAQHHGWVSVSRDGSIRTIGRVEPAGAAPVIAAAKTIVEILEQHGDQLSQPYLLECVASRAGTNDHHDHHYWPAIAYCVKAGWVSVASNGHIQLTTKATI